MAGALLLLIATIFSAARIIAKSITACLKGASGNTFPFACQALFA
jgi:hypothetical protein